MQAIFAGLAILAANPGNSPGSAAGLEKGQDVLVVLTLKPLGVDPTEIEAVTSQIAELAASRSQLRVVMFSEIDTLVGRSKELDQFGCADESCFAELSKVANARFVLSGTLGKVGDDILLNVSLFDSEIPAAIGKSSRSVASASAIQEVLPSLLAEVFGWERVGPPKAPYRLPTDREVSFAVFDIIPLGIAKHVAQNLTQVLAAQIKEIQGTTVISRDDIVAMLQLQAEQMNFDCSDDTTCLAEIGGALGVDKLVVGHAAKLAGDFVVSLRLIDVRKVNVDNRVTESFDGLENQLLGAIRHAGRRLVGVAADEPGTLALTGSQTEAVVSLDNESIGVLPMHPVERLSPGRHTVRITKKGFVDWRSDFYVEPSGVTSLWADLEEMPPAWYERWWVWAIAGGVALTAGGIYYWQESQLPNSDLGTYSAR